MKLFTRYSRVNIIASILALLLGSIGYYFTVRYVLVHQLDDTLKIEEAEIMDFAQTRNRLPRPANYRDQQISFQPAPAPVTRAFIDRSGPPEQENAETSHPQQQSDDASRHGRHHRDREPYRQLIFPVQVAGQWYTASVSESQEETEDLLELIMMITAGMILLLLGTLFLANRLLLRRIWQPFYQTVAAMREFNLSSRNPLPASRTDIDEFRNLDE